MADRSSPLSGLLGEGGPGDAPASSRANRSYLSEMKRNDAANASRYEQMMRDEGLDPDTGLELESPRAPRSPFAPRLDRQFRSAASSSAGGTIAGTALGALAYFMGVAYLRGGGAGLKNWLKAKFVNITPGSTSSLPVGKSTTTNATTSPGATAPAAARVQA